MKTAAILSCAFVLALFAPFAVQADEGIASQTVPNVEVAEAPVAEADAVQPFPADFALTLDAVNCPTAMIGPGPLPTCGDYCYQPGFERGCVDRSGSSPRRVPCICQNGTWQCGTF